MTLVELNDIDRLTRVLRRGPRGFGPQGGQKEGVTGLEPVQISDAGCS
jgi:hypothetical protein